LPSYLWELAVFLAQHLVAAVSGWENGGLVLTGGDLRFPTSHACHYIQTDLYVTTG
jgi:hypothetical protein